MSYSIYFQTRFMRSKEPVKSSTPCGNHHNCDLTYSSATVFNYDLIYCSTINYDLIYCPTTRYAFIYSSTAFIRNPDIQSQCVLPLSKFHVHDRRPGQLNICSCNGLKKTTGQLRVANHSLR